MSDPIEVLLVCTVSNDQEFILNLLSHTNSPTFELKCVSDLGEATATLAGTTYQGCLIDDRTAPDGGLDLIREILKFRPQLPIVVLSWRDEPIKAIDSLLAGAVDILIASELTAASLKRAIMIAIERKRAEITFRLRDSEELASLTAAIDNLPVSVLITDARRPDNAVVFVNPAFTQITGYERHDVLGRDPRILLDPDGEPSLRAAVDSAVKNRRPFRGVVRNRRKDGSIYRNSLAINPVFGRDGEITNFIGVGQDITAQYETEEALRDSELSYRGMVANVPGMIYRVLRRTDATAKFLFVSEGCRALFGLAPEEFRAEDLTLRTLIHPEDLPSFVKIAAPPVTEAPQQWRWQGRCVLHTGEEKIVECFSHPNVQENGDVIWDGLLMDVTERARAEQKAAHLAAIVEGSVDAIKGKTLDGIVTSWNHAAEKLYGYSADEMIGHPIDCVLPPDRPGEIVELLGRVRQGEQVHSYETVRRAKDGTLLDIALTISPIKDDAGKIIGAASIAQDIRPRKLAEAQSSRQLMRLQALRNIDMAITGSLDLRVTLNVFLDQVTTHLDVDCASVLLHNQHTHRLEFAAGRGFRTDGVQHTRLRIGEGIAGRAALDRRVVHIPNIQLSRTEFVRAKMIAEERFVGYCAAPLISKGKVEGMLEIFHRSPLRIDSDWMSFMEALAGQAAIAIENAALFDDVQRSNVELQVAYDCTLEGWSKALDLRDKETEGHTLRVTEATMALARAMDVSDTEINQMRRGALLHDIGKMGVPDAILLKPGPLTDAEWVIMKKHPVYAYEMLSPIQFLRPALDIPYCHHEKWDGTGYPRGLKGEHIPLSARIFAVVDVWDALKSERPYRAGWPAPKVRDYIAAGRDQHFEPRIVDAFLDYDM